MSRVLTAIVLAVVVALALTGCAGIPASIESANPAALGSARVFAESVVATQVVAEPEPESTIAFARATVVRVVDGDTAVFRLEDGTEEKTRFIGIDTPESTNSHEIYGSEASSYTGSILAVDRAVFLETDAEQRDRYGRLLAYVWLSKPRSDEDSEVRAKMLNAQLALTGYAQQMTIQPNSKYAALFTSYVSEARTAEAGLWSSEVLSQQEAEVALLKAEGEAKAAAEAAQKKAAAKKTSKKKASSPTVYITDSGKKYHSDGCQYLRSSRHAVSLSGAISQGLDACSRCDPP